MDTLPEPSREVLFVNMDTDVAPRAASRPHLSARDAITLLLGLQIGSGIFASPSRVDNNVPSPLLAWLVSGILAWTGATSFAELGCLMPVNGGMQEYLRTMYGDAVAAVMAWTVSVIILEDEPFYSCTLSRSCIYSELMQALLQKFLWNSKDVQNRYADSRFYVVQWIVAVKPSAMAILSIALVESLESVVGSGGETWEKKGLAILALGFVLGGNCISANATKNISRVFVILKLVAVGLVLLAGITVVGLHVLSPRYTSTALSSDWYTRSWLATRNTKDIDWSSVSLWTSLGYFSTAVYAGLWAFSGWDNVRAVFTYLLCVREMLIQ
jgi:L-type amino acid transporter 9